MRNLLVQRVEQATARLAATRVLAPGDGIVQSLFAQPGGRLEQGAVIARLELRDLNTVWVRAQFSAKDGALLKQGMPCRVLLADGDFAGRSYGKPVGDYSTGSAPASSGHSSEGASGEASDAAASDPKSSSASSSAFGERIVEWAAVVEEILPNQLYASQALPPLGPLHQNSPNVYAPNENLPSGNPPGKFMYNENPLLENRPNPNAPNAARPFENLPKSTLPPEPVRPDSASQPAAPPGPQPGLTPPSGLTPPTSTVPDRPIPPNSDAPLGQPPGQTQKDKNTPDNDKSQTKAQALAENPAEKAVETPDMGNGHITVRILLVPTPGQEQQTPRLGSSATVIVGVPRYAAFM
jgi:pyruvate/2-oxoglutarate dehydrogenase complex dihydrolipoamide acyltransferase (E2) component